MKCCMCKKKQVKYIVGKGNIYEYGFCSKTCIANNAIKHFNMKKADDEREILK